MTDQLPAPSAGIIRKLTMQRSVRSGHAAFRSALTAMFGEHGKLA
jgi:hypothetical protein